MRPLPIVALVALLAACDIQFPTGWPDNPPQGPVEIPGVLATPAWSGTWIADSGGLDLTMYIDLAVCDSVCRAGGSAFYVNESTGQADSLYVSAVIRRAGHLSIAGDQVVIELSRWGEDAGPPGNELEGVFTDSLSLKGILRAAGAPGAVNLMGIDSLPVVLTRH